MHSHELFHACVALTLLATLAACGRASDGVDVGVLWACAATQLGLLLSCIPGIVAHKLFVIALSYAAFFGGRTLLGIAAALLACTLLLRLLCGGCLFNVVEGDRTLIPRKGWGADFKLLLLLGLAMFRLRCDAPVLSSTQRLMGLIVIMAWVHCTW